MTFRVRHLTRYVYEQDVTASYGRLHLLPTDLPGQHVTRATIEIDPHPGAWSEHVDTYGNRSAYFEVLEPHRSLQLVASSDVDTSGRDAEVARVRGHEAGARPWERAAEALAAATDPAGLAAREFRLDSPRVAGTQRLGAYARRSFTPGRGVVDGALDLCRRIHEDFEFNPGATSVHTTVDEVLDGREGVCQDFAHLAIGTLRALGLAARYVSGYLETVPPPGRERLQGADASHAWVSLYVPGSGWLDLDPTNDQPAGERHVTVAVGRDYADVAPLTGVIFTEGTTDELVVEVDVLRLDDARAPTDADESRI